jgi:predicted transcriptional regulator
MDFLWKAKEASIREITEGFTVGEFTQRSLAYTTVQTVVYRLEEKGVVRRSGKVGNFHIFVPIVSRDKAQRRLLDELMEFFGGRGKLVMAHLIETGELTLDDVKEAEGLLKQSRKRRKSE